MTYVKIDREYYPAQIMGRIYDSEWNGRESKAITLQMTYSSAAELFVDGLNWFIVQQEAAHEDGNGNLIAPRDIEYDNSDFCISGPITDNRDGTVTVKMGKPTEIEELRSKLVNAVTEEELEAAYMEGVNSL